MKQINVIQMEAIVGGDAVESFCAGFGAVATVYQVGVWANLWNPVGWGATALGLAIGVGCAGYALR